MSLYDRAAQFAPFAALTGYDDMIVEEARETDTRVELEAWELEQLNQKLTLIADVLEDGNKPRLTFNVFVPDEKKAGGKFVDLTDTVKAPRQFVVQQSVLRQPLIQKIFSDPSRHNV